MTDIDGLKQRINLVDLRLQTAHSARERESAALMEMWDEMRARYTEQQGVIDALRNEVAGLEDSRAELLSLVSSLLEAVEQGVEQIADNTMPDITSSVTELLGSSLEETQIPEGDEGQEARAEEIKGVSEEESAPPMNNEGILDLISRLESSVADDDEIEFSDALSDEAEENPISQTDDDEELDSLRAELERLRNQAVAATG